MLLYLVLSWRSTTPVTQI